MIVIRFWYQKLFCPLLQFLAWERAAKNSSKIQIDTPLMNEEMTKHDFDAYHVLMKFEKSVK